MAAEEKCEPSVTTSSTFKGPICRGALIFEDTFDFLDTSKWSHEVSLSGGGVSLFIIRKKHLFLNISRFARTGSSRCTGMTPSIATPRMETWSFTLASWPTSTAKISSGVAQSTLPKGIRVVSLVRRVFLTK